MEVENKNMEIPAQYGKHFSRLGFAYLFGAVIMLGIQYLLVLVISMIQIIIPQFTADTDLLMTLSSLSMYGVAMPLLILMAQRVPAVKIQEHSGNKMGFGKWLTAFFMCYALMYLSNLFGIFLTAVFGLVTGNPVSNPVQEVTMDMSPLTVFVLVVLLAPFAEEYVFRKVLIDRVAQYGEKIAILLSGLMFGLFHGNLNQFVYAFGLGAFFGFIYVKTGRLRYTIALHALINFMGSIPGILLLKMEIFTQAGDIEASMEMFMRHPLQLMIYILYLIVVLIFVIVGVVFWALHFKKLKCAPGMIEIPKGRRFQTVILNVGMGLYCLFWIVQMIQQLFA